MAHNRTLPEPIALTEDETDWLACFVAKSCGCSSGVAEEVVASGAVSIEIDLDRLDERLARRVTADFDRTHASSS